MWELIEKGGILMYPIMASSVFALAIIFERMLVIGRVKILSESDSEIIFDLVRKNKIDAATDLAKNGQSPSHEVLSAILEDTSCEEVEEKAASIAGDHVLRRLTQRLEWLAILGSLVPLMGLLGTVVGMIRVFNNVAAAGDVSDISILAGGIWEALLTTAAGMTVAIPILLIYHWFQGKIDKVAFEMRHHGNELIAALRKCGISS